MRKRDIIYALINVVFAGVIIMLAHNIKQLQDRKCPPVIVNGACVQYVHIRHLGIYPSDSICWQKRFREISDSLEHLNINTILLYDNGLYLLGDQPNWYFSKITHKIGANKNGFVRIDNNPCKTVKK